MALCLPCYHIRLCKWHNLGLHIRGIQTNLRGIHAAPHFTEFGSYPTHAFVDISIKLLYFQVSAKLALFNSKLNSLLAVAGICSKSLINNQTQSLKQPLKTLVSLQIIATLRNNLI